MAVRCGDGAHHAEGFRLAVGAGGAGDEGHFTVVVDLRQAGHVAARKLLDVMEEAVDQVLLAHLREEGIVGRLVFRAYRAEQHRPPVAQRSRLFQRLRIGLDRQAVGVDRCRG